LIGIKLVNCYVYNCIYLFMTFNLKYTSSLNVLDNLALLFQNVTNFRSNYYLVLKTNWWKLFYLFNSLFLVISLFIARLTFQFVICIGMWKNNSITTGYIFKFTKSGTQLQLSITFTRPTSCHSTLGFLLVLKFYCNLKNLI
jgi:hypothetical protein